MPRSIQKLTRAELIDLLTQQDSEYGASQQRTDQRQRVLTRVSSVLASSLDVDATLQSVAHLALPTLADWCSVLLLDANHYRRVARASIFDADIAILNRLPAHIDVTNAQSSTDAIFIQGQTELHAEFSVSDADRLAASSDHAQAMFDLQTCSMIRTPMIARERTLGLMVFAYGRSKRRYSEADIPLLEEVAHSAALAIENARLYQSTQRRLTELNTIQQIATLINSTVPLATAFQDIVDIVSAAFGYRMLSIYLLKEDFLHLQAVVGYEHVVPVFHKSLGMSGRVLRTGQLIFVRDAEQERDYIKATSNIRQGIHAPLRRANGEVIGLIILESTNESLSDDDAAILMLVAHQVSVAVTNANLFDALRNSEYRYRTLIDQAADAILLTDHEWHITDVNRQAVRMFGDPPQQLIGTQLTDRTVMLSGSTRWPPDIGTTFQIRTNTGELYPVEASINTIMEEQQPRNIIIIRDISDRLRAEELQRATERQLLEAQKLESLGVLAGGIAHDFNNLLMAIQGNAGLAALEVPTASPALISLAQIEVAARRAVDLTQQMLAYAGKMRLQQEPINLSMIVQGLSSLLRSIVSRTITITFQLQPDLPLVLGDSSQLRRVVLNLATNASEVIADQVGTITIFTQLYQLTQAETSADGWNELVAGEYAALIMSDSGPGIEPQLLLRIFEPFFSTKVAGHGLGLAAAQGIIRAHGGALRVESSIGTGTRFTILLPTITLNEPSIIGV